MFSDKSLENMYEPRSKEWNKLFRISEEYANKMYKMQNIHVNMKKFSKHGFCNDPLPSNYLHLCDKFEVEIAVLEIKRHDIDNKRRKIWDEMEGLFKITKQNSHLKKVSKLEKRRLEREICSICYESHSIKQLVTTSCGHTFGKCCLSRMIEHNYENGAQIMCPYCRNEHFKLTRHDI